MTEVLVKISSLKRNMNRRKTGKINLDKWEERFEKDLVPPIVINQNKAVIDGEYRICAAELLGREYIKAVIKNAS